MSEQPDDHQRELRDRAACRAAEVVGITGLAPGADFVFAGVLIVLGGRLEVILPSADYRRFQLRPEDRIDFDELLGPV